MKLGSTMFLRAVIALIALAVLAICTLVFPAAILSDMTGMYTPILLGLYVSAVPFFVALYQSTKLLGYIDKNQAFTQLSVNVLRCIKHCGVIIAALFTLSMPYIYITAGIDDAPGVIVIGLVIIFASTVVATFAAVLQKLIQNAVDIKSENDLTV